VLQPLPQQGTLTGNEFQIAFRVRWSTWGGRVCLSVYFACVHSPDSVMTCAARPVIAADWLMQWTVAGQSIRRRLTGVNNSWRARRARSGRIVVARVCRRSVKRLTETRVWCMTADRHPCQKVDWPLQRTLRLINHRTLFINRLIRAVCLSQCRINFSQIRRARAERRKAKVCGRTIIAAKSLVVNNYLYSYCSTFSFTPWWQRSHNFARYPRFTKTGIEPVAPTPWRTGGHVSPLLQMAGHRGTVSRRTANKKLTKLYWPPRKRSPKRLIVLLEPKKWRDTTKNFFPALCVRRVPPPTFAPDSCLLPHFKIRSGATG